MRVAATAPVPMDVKGLELVNAASALGNNTNTPLEKVAYTVDPSINTVCVEGCPAIATFCTEGDNTNALLAPRRVLVISSITLKTSPLVVPGGSVETVPERLGGAPAKDHPKGASTATGEVIFNARLDQRMRVMGNESSLGVILGSVNSII